MQPGELAPENKFPIKIILLINSFEQISSSEFSFHAIENDSGTVSLPSKQLIAGETCQQCIDKIIAEHLILDLESPIECNLIDVIDSIEDDGERAVRLVFNIALNRGDNHYFHKTLSMFENKSIFTMMEEQSKISNQDTAAILISTMGVSRQVKNGRQ